MSERREPGFNLDELSDPVPTLEPEPPKKSISNSPEPGASPPSSPRKGSGVSIVLAVFALFASAAMGFWNFTLTQKLDDQSILIEQMNLWLESTDATLIQTSTTASQSGETLSSRLEQIGARVDERVKHFDSEIAKLWTVSYQRNKPLLEEQGKQLADQKAEVSDLSDGFKVLTQKLDKQDDTLTNINQTQSLLSKATDQLLEDFASTQQQLTRLVSNDNQAGESIKALEQRIAQLTSDLDFQLSIERDERAKLVDRLEQTSQSASETLMPRVSEIEARLGAIDSSRQSVNSELLKIKQQLNTLMLEGAIR